MDHSIAVSIAARAQLGPAAQRAAASMSDLRLPLAENVFIEMDKDLWFELYRLKPKPAPVALASALAARKLDDDQLDHVLADARMAPVKQALSYNELSPERLRGILADARAAELSKHVLELCYVTDEALRFDLQCAAGGLELLSALTGRPDAEVIDHLGRWDQWAPGPSRARASELSALLFERPAVVSWCANSRITPLVSAACGSRHLRDLDDQLAAVAHAKSCTSKDADDMVWGLLRLVNLPACSLDVVQRVADWATAEKLRDAALRRLAAAATKPSVAEAYEKVSDTSVLEWLCRRALPNRFDSTGKPSEVYALAFNPHLTADQASSVMLALASHSVAAVIGYESASRALQAVVTLQGGTQPEPYWATMTGGDDKPASRIATRRAPEPWSAGFDPENQPIGNLLQWGAAPLLGWLIANIADDEDVWRAVFSLVDANPTATLEDIALLAAATA